MSESLVDKVALVTGGGSGIGLEVSRSLVVRGARVVVAGRRPEVLAAAVSQLGPAYTSVVLDVREADSVAQAVAETVRWGGGLDVLVNNAGISTWAGSVTEHSLEAWQSTLETNLTGAFLMSREAWPHLQLARGQILNISSIAGTRGYAGSSAYCASKFGLNGLTEVLKIEGQPLGIRVLSFCPAAIDTDIWGQVASSAEHKRMMRPEDIGEFCAELLALPRSLDVEHVVVPGFQNPFAAE